MVDYADSSQANEWLFQSPDELNLCRAKANRKARVFLTSSSSEQNQKQEADGTSSNDGGGGGGESSAAASTVNGGGDAGESGNGSKSSSTAKWLPSNAENFARGFSCRLRDGTETGTADEGDGDDSNCWENSKGHKYLNPEEEATLVSFYASKLPTLIGPKAMVPRLRRESKVTATAALLLRRFFLSNSVMMYDPKAVMVASAFLGSKIEDSTADIRHLEEGTSAMNAPVDGATEIIPSEIALIQGIRFDLLCFHPYRAVLALTEDLRTYLKSDKGKALVTFPHRRDDDGGGGVVISGQDLKPMYETARQLVDDSALSDLPLLHSPGHIGLAALMVAQEQVQQQQQQSSSPANMIPQIDLIGYVRQRFEQENAGEGSGGDGKRKRMGNAPAGGGSSDGRGAVTAATSKAAMEEMEGKLSELCGMLRSLKDGMHGCGLYKTDMQALKGIHKKLKKVRLWGNSKDKDGSGGGGGKKKKRDKHSASGDNVSPSKKSKK